ncbi:hypothetical protein PAMP_004833 [Pampus punctatissimus]
MLRASDASSELHPALPVGDRGLVQHSSDSLIDRKERRPNTCTTLTEEELRGLTVTVLL